MNAQTVSDSYPAPTVEDIVRKLGDGDQVFLTLDASQAYLSIPLAETLREYTAFSTPMGLSEFNQTVFGLLNAGARYN